MTLTDYTGPTTIREAGTVISGVRTSGALTIEAPNVVIRNSHIRGRVYLSPWTNASLLIEDSEIDGSGIPASESAHLSGLSYSNITARRVNIHHFGKELQVDSNVTVEDSWLHNVRTYGDHHTEAMMSNGGSNVTLRGNTIDSSGDYTHITGSVVLLGDFATIDNVLIEGNRIWGGGYAVYAGSQSGKPYAYARNTRFVDNVFVRTDALPNSGYWGPVTAYRSGNGNEWTGNTWEDSGNSVNP